MASVKKYMKCLACVAGGTVFLAAGSLAVLSLDSVQEKIACVALDQAGIRAEFGAWESRRFSEFHLREIVLERGNDCRVTIPDLKLRVGLFSLIFSSRLDLEASFEKTNRVTLAGKDFELAVEACRLSNLAGAKNRLAGTLVARKGEAPAQAQFIFESENSSFIREAALPAWLAGTRSARLNFAGIECVLEESGTWTIADGDSARSALVGSGTLREGALSGTLLANLDGERFRAFGIGDSLPRWSARCACNLAGELSAGSYSLQPQFDIRVAEPAGTFSGIALLPEMRLNGKGCLDVHDYGFTVKNCFAELSAVPKSGDPVVFAELSVPGQLRVAYSPENGLEIGGEDRSGGLARLRFNAVPLALANPFIAQLPQGQNVELAGTLDGNFVLTRETDGVLRLAGKDALELRDFALKMGNDTILSGLSARLPVSASLCDNTASVELKNARVTGENGVLVAGADCAGTRDFALETTRLEAAVRVRSEALSQKCFEGFFTGLSDKAIAAEAKFKAEVSDNEIAVSALNFSVYESGESARTLLSADTEAFRFEAGNPFIGLAGKQIKFRAQAFPLALLDPLARRKFFFSGTLDGEIAFVGEKDKLAFVSGKRGVTIRNFYMENAQRLPLLRGLFLRSDENRLNISRDDSGRFLTELSLKHARLKDGADRRLASGDLYLNFSGRELVTLNGELEGDLGGICSQALLAPIGNIGGGTLEMHGGWDVPNRTAKLEINCRNLCSRGSDPVSLEGLRWVCEHNPGAGSETVARLQMTLEGSERSYADLRFSKLDWSWREVKADFDAVMNAEKIVVEDLMRLAEMLAPAKGVAAVAAVTSAETITASRSSAVRVSEAESGAKALKPSVPQSASVSQNTGKSAKPQYVAVPSKPARPELPWEGLTGRLQFRIDECVVPENRIQDITGALQLNPNRGEIVVGSNAFFGGTLKSKTVLEVREDTASYFAKTKVVVNDSRIYEAVPALRAENPPIVEGTFDLDLSAESLAPNLDALVRNVSAEASLLGRDGRIRIFAADNDNLRNVGEWARVGGSVAELVGAFGGKKLRRTVKAANRLREYLENFPFEQQELRLCYKAGKPIVCEKFLLRNDLLKITGKGEIDYSESVPIQDAPLAMRTRLDVRGELEELMTTLGILKQTERVTESDGTSYAVGPEFKCSGTLNRFSNNLLETLLNAH